GGNNFSSIQLFGAQIDINATNIGTLAGVLASGPFNALSTSSLTVSAPLQGSAGVSLTALNGAMNINASVGTTSGDLVLNASQAITQSAGTTLSAGGSVTVTAGTSTQIADVTAGNGVSIKATSGSATFISPLTINGPFLATAAGDVTFNQSINGGGDLTVNTTGVTSFGGAIGLHNLITNVGGTTVITGGSLAVTGSFLFNDPVTVGATTAISGPSGWFNSTFNGSQNVVFNPSGDFVFAGAVGGIQPLTSLTANTGRMLFFGGAVSTSGAQTYNTAVLLGQKTTFNASALTFNNTVNTATQSAQSSLNPAATVAVASAPSDLLANVSGPASFNGPVGTAANRIGLVTTNATTTSIAADIFATGVTLNNPATFVAGSAFVDTTDSQTYGGAVRLSSNLTFKTDLDKPFVSGNTPSPGIAFLQGITVDAPNRTLTITAPKATITTGGDLGGSATNARLDTLLASGRYLVFGGSIYARSDIRLAMGTATTGDNDFLQFTGTGNTFVDSAVGEIVLGSGAVPNTTVAKAGAPLRSSIFKSNAGDLYLFGRKVTVQPFERLTVRNGSLIAIADGPAATDSVTMSSAAATTFLVLVSSAPLDVTQPGIIIRSRPAAAITLANGSPGSDRGTELVAGAVLFFNTNLNGSKNELPSPTRTTFIPAPALSTTTGFFDYRAHTGNLLQQPAGATILGITPDGTSVFVADLVISNSFRPIRANLLYLDLSSLNFATPEGFIDPTSSAAFLGTPDAPIRTLTTQNALPRVVLQQAFTPVVPRGDAQATPPEVDLAAAVREQLQALGIYARGLSLAEKQSRERHRGLFVTVPERERARESDYEVAEARVEERAVREVLRLATETGLIGDDQHKLDGVAKALAASFEAFSTASAKTEPGDFRAWLETSKNDDAVQVLAYIKTLSDTLRRIELLGLTRAELASSKAQIYGSILRARLNVEPEFFRNLVEGVPADVRVSAVPTPPDDTTIVAVGSAP
ncbi:MAG: Autotransporter-associated beta strand repeat-containing protein, partial [Lacunisphaera sp.]|nr:Autotransporter-associated beta strand repeat-containing protein [Lacunisphaera sp.]